MKFMFSTAYRVTKKKFYTRPYTSMWAPVVVRQISKRYSSSCHLFISMWGVISSTASMIRCLRSARYLSNFSPVHNKDVVYRRKVREISGMWGVISSTASMIRCLKSTRSRTSPYHWSSWAYNTSHADKHVARAWILFRNLSSYNRCPHWSVQTCIKIFLSYSVHCWKHKFHKAFRY